jgi:hypothetical protein
MEETTQNATEQSTENKGDGNIPTTANLLDRADSIAKRLEAANAQAEKRIAREEAIAARMLISGRSEAGIPPKTVEQTEKEKVDEDIKKTLGRFIRTR